jgi:hypothetical protein
MVMPVPCTGLSFLFFLAEKEWPNWEVIYGINKGND